MSTREIRVGFIGLGVMGRPMAPALRAGHQVAVWARRAEALAPWSRPVPPPAPIRQPSRATARSFYDRYLRPRRRVGRVRGAGLAQGMAAGSVLVDMSTIAPGLARDIAPACPGRGAIYSMRRFPAVGSGAEAGTLAIMVGGEAAVLERVRPPSRCWAARSCMSVGPAPGRSAKACNPDGHGGGHPGLGGSPASGGGGRRRCGGCVKR